MSLERGRKAIQLQMPDEIPHTQYLSNYEYMAYITGLGVDDPNLGLEATRKLDYDLVWTTDAPELRGRLTDLGVHYWGEMRPAKDTRRNAFQNVKEVLAFDPVEEYGLANIEEKAKEYQARYEDAQKGAFDFCVYPGGIYRTIVSFMIAAFGWELLLEAAGTNLKRFEWLIERFFEVSRSYYLAWARTDIEAFICHDDMVWAQGAFMQPACYRKNIFPRYRELWRPLKERGIKLLFCSDGNFTEFVDDLAEAGADGFIFEPITDLAYVVRNYGRTHVIIGNADCRILMRGNEDEIRADVKRCLDLGRDCPGYFFAVGNHIPAGIPVENVALCMDTYFELRRR
jgi:hypothetical protein